MLTWRVDVGSESADVDGEGVGDGEAVGDACCGGVFRVMVIWNWEIGIGMDGSGGFLGFGMNVIPCDGFGIWCLSLSFYLWVRGEL